MDQYTNIVSLLSLNREDENILNNLPLAEEEVNDYITYDENENNNIDFLPCSSSINNKCDDTDMIIDDKNDKNNINSIDMKHKYVLITKGIYKNYLAKVKKECLDTDKLYVLSLLEDLLVPVLKYDISEVTTKLSRKSFVLLDCSIESSNDDILIELNNKRSLHQTSIKITSPMSNRSNLMLQSKEKRLLGDEEESV